MLLTAASSYDCDSEFCFHESGLRMTWEQSTTGELKLEGRAADNAVNR